MMRGESQTGAGVSATVIVREFGGELGEVKVMWK